MLIYLLRYLGDICSDSRGTWQPGASQIDDGWLCGVFLGLHIKNMDQDILQTWILDIFGTYLPIWQGSRNISGINFVLIFCFHFVWSVIVGACMRMWINPPNTERSLKSIFRWKLHNVFFSPPLHFSLYCLVGRKNWAGIDFQWSTSLCWVSFLSLI